MRSAASAAEKPARHASHPSTCAASVATSSTRQAPAAQRTSVSSEGHPLTLTRRQSTAVGSRGLALIATSLTAISLTAQAQPASAGAAFDEARALLAQGRVAEACERFALSHRQEPALGTLLNLADCRDRLGATATAFTLFNEAQAWAERNREAKRAQAAKDRASALRARLSMVALEPLGNEPRATAEVVSSQGVSVARWNLDVPQSIALDPGRYEVRVEAEGFEPASVPFIVSVAGVMKVVVPALRAVVANVPPKQRAPPQVSSPPKPVEPSSPRWVGPTVLAGGAVAAVGFGLLLGFALDVVARANAQQTQGALTVTRGAWQAAVLRAVIGGIGTAAGLGAVVVGIALGAGPAAPTSIQLSLVARW